MKKFSVGGVVRDELLGLKPKDHDWLLVGVTEADMAELKAQGYSQVGADFPVLLHPITGDEYALARVERKSGVGYHGFTVHADEHVTVEEDLSRRDLTINSMARGEDGVLVDPYHGLKDLRNKVLRHTTEAFAEDPLRVLRLARFAARMPDWTIAEETLELCHKLTSAGELNHLSVERIWAELEKGFNETSPERFMGVLNKTGALQHCKVLNEMFGELQHWQLRVLKGLDYTKHYDMDRLVVAVSLLAAFNGVSLDQTSSATSSKLKGAPTRVRECYEAVKAMVEGNPFSEDMAAKVLKLLKKTRVLQEGPAFEDFVQCLYVCEKGGAYVQFTAKKILMCAEAVRSVKAMHFENLEGKALGEAMDAKRLSNLTALLY